MGKSERLTLALFLFAVAITIYGIRKVENLRGYELSKELAGAIIHTLQFADKNFPNEGYVDIGFSIWKNRDTIHIDRLNREITSDRNFTYFKDGYKLTCTVKVSGEYYTVTCWAK